jgi:hypothetical protein
MASKTMVALNDEGYQLGQATNLCASAVLSDTKIRYVELLT